MTNEPNYTTGPTHATPPLTPDPLGGFATEAEKAAWDGANAEPMSDEAGELKPIAERLEGLERACGRYRQKLAAAEARVAELEETVAFFEGMKAGVAIRIADLEARHASLLAKLKGLEAEICDDVERDMLSDVQAGWTLTSRLQEIADQLAAITQEAEDAK